MKISTLSLLVIYLNTITLASPPKGGIGDGYIYPATKMGSKPKSTTTYYAKPLHPPMKRPKPMIYKVIIHDQPPQNAAKQEQIFKIIHLPKRGGGNGGGNSGGNGGLRQDKSVKILKIIQVKQPKGGHGGGWSK